MDIFTAVSLNNKIVSSNCDFDFKKLSTEKILDLRETIRSAYGTIIVGANTVMQDNPTLLNTKRDNKRIIIDKYQNLDINLNIFNIEPQNTYIITTNNETYRKMIESKGANFIIVNNDNDILDQIHKISDGKILVEGGAKLISKFINLSCIDTISVIQFPVIYSNDSLGMFDYVEENYRLKLSKADIIDSQFVYLTYKLERNKI